MKKKTVLLNCPALKRLYYTKKIKRINGKWEAITKYFRYKGEIRNPKKGEFYLSGAVVDVWQAPNDLLTSFHIAVEVPAPPKEVFIDGALYLLSILEG